MEKSGLTSLIRKKATMLGFDACGFAQAEPVSEMVVNDYRHWIQNGFNGEMRYMENNMDKRFNPQLLMDNCKTVAVFAINHYTVKHFSESAPRVAKFAYSVDYHDLVRNKLRTLLNLLAEDGIHLKGRAFCDSAPILERYWAVKAGLGWIGKNQNLIIPGKGSFFFLGILLLDTTLEYDQPMKNRCGRCERCLRACPTRALNKQTLDANKCLSYLTIEKKGDFSSAEHKRMQQSNWIFGCDICQEACPWNRFSTVQTAEIFEPISPLESWSMQDWQLLDETHFNETFKNSCLFRTTYAGIQRNLKSVQTPKKNNTSI